MRRVRAVMAAPIAVGLLLVTATSAHAVTGANVLNNCASQPGTSVDVWNASGQSRRLYPCASSTDYLNTRYRVQKFRVNNAPGFTGCDARSQYSPSGSYPYKAGTVYAMSQNDLYLHLTISCRI